LVSRFDWNCRNRILLTKESSMKRIKRWLWDHLVNVMVGINV